MGARFGGEIQSKWTFEEHELSEERRAEIGAVVSIAQGIMKGTVEASAKVTKRVADLTRNSKLQVITRGGTGDAAGGADERDGGDGRGLPGAALSDDQVLALSAAFSGGGDMPEDTYVALAGGAVVRCAHARVVALVQRAARSHHPCRDRRRRCCGRF